MIFSMSCSLSSPALKCYQQKKAVPLVEIDLSNLEDEVGESSSNTSDNSQSEHDLASTVDVGVLDSQNVSELVCLSQYNR